MRHNEFIGYCRVLNTNGTLKHKIFHYLFYGSSLSNKETAAMFPVIAAVSLRCAEDQWGICALRKWVNAVISA